MSLNVVGGGTWAKVSEVFRGDTYVKALSSEVGVPDDSIRMFLSLLAGYPLAFIYRSAVYGRSSTTQHVYFILCGMYMGYFNFGLEVLHSLANMIIIYGLIWFAGGTRMSMVAAFFINTGYFLIGCATSSKTGDQYRIEWTTSHCVLILKLTGVVADLYDGSKPLDKLGADQKETAIQKKPTLLQLIGHCYFFGGFLIGPQCSIKRYLTLVEGGFSSKGNGVPDSLLAGLTKLGVGLVYIGNLLLLNFLVPTNYLFTKEFHDLLLPLKCLYVLVWGRFVLTRYISCWHISEGICILTGLTYNGIDKNGKSRWDSSQNIKLYEFETSYTLYNLTKAFNVQTSTWMVKYLMKRLRFLGNKELSKFFTFAYLALWHGLYSGYFNTFFLEFLMIATETYVIDRLKHKKVPPFPKGKLNGVWLWFLFRAIYCQFFWSYALISFELLQFQNYWEVYSSMYFIGHLCHPLVILITYLIFKRPPRKSENGIQKEKEL